MGRQVCCKSAHKHPIADLVLWWWFHWNSYSFIIVCLISYSLDCYLMWSWLIIVIWYLCVTLTILFSHLLPRLKWMSWRAVWKHRNIGCSRPMWLQTTLPCVTTWARSRNLHRLPGALWSFQWQVGLFLTFHHSHLYRCYIIILTVYVLFHHPRLYRCYFIILSSLVLFYHSTCTCVNSSFSRV